MRAPTRSICAVAVAVLLLVPQAAVSKTTPVYAGPTPRAHCGPGSRPEVGIQGRVSPQDVSSGRAAKGFACNVRLVSHYGVDSSAGSGGYRVYRYIDKAHHECAFYDTTLLFPASLQSAVPDLTGVYVLDMKNPHKPVRTDNMLTPAMQTPHESFNLNVHRGLLAAVAANPVFAPGVVDVYDITADCRHPVLKSSTPTGGLGHEGAFSPDGKTFWVTSTSGKLVTAVDLTDPMLPSIVWQGQGDDWNIHGLSISNDGTRAYLADLGTHRGVTVIDVSQIQQRAASPQVKLISRVTWSNVSVPQTTIPVTIRGHKYLVEIDEFARGVSADPAAPVGAGRIIDIGDEKHPRVISNLTLEVDMPKGRKIAGSDDGMSSSLQGYAGHYCATPTRYEPGIVACSFILSGLRVFDIRDPYHPREIAYYNAPRGADGSKTNYAMSAPTFAPTRGEIWFSDGNHGFYDVQVTNGVWPFRKRR